MSALVTIEAVPIAKVGTWRASTGEVELTTAHFEDAVRAQHDPVFRWGVIKLGHDDPRFNGPDGDGEPAVGQVVNLRVTPDGQTLLADLVGVPAWLATIMASAYPSRSMEADLGVQTTSGATYSMVVTGLALLGVARPAIESLGDIAQLYQVPTDVGSWTSAATVAASLPMEVTVPQRRLGQVVLSASIDELVTAAESWARDQPTLGDAYIRDVYTDYLVMSVWLAGGENRLYRVDWSESTDGTFAFGTPVRVRQTYEAIPEATTSVAASAAMGLLACDVMARRYHDERSEAVLSRRGRDVTTTGAHPEETHVPLPSAIAAALGLADDVDDATALAAIEALRTAPTPPTEPEGGTPPAPTIQTTPAPVADVQALVQQQVAAALGPVMATVREQSTELATLRQERATSTRDTVIQAALNRGAIAPAAAETWRKRYDEHPGITTELLAEKADGEAVPLRASGHLGEIPDSTVDAEWAKVAASLGVIQGG
jgi:hypothetical protein